MDAELFYVLDVGDAFGSLLSHVVHPTLANAVGHLVSFAVNASIWLGLAAVAVRVI